VWDECRRAPCQECGEWKAFGGEWKAEAEKNGQLCANTAKERDEWKASCVNAGRDWSECMDNFQKAKARLAEVATMLREWLATAEREPGLRTILAKAEGREAGK
jgi:hypothetical protein